ncbi:MAG: flagellar hook-associated protein FlgK [Rhizobiales bacterium 65-9]|nr:flagellar hook-associated protein FlgK [Hyphomicrobiales bacterium]OJY34298.1 MAG: flagellar hook-associated protein FlgK [Rhizobiales bacterium 65-9]
MGIGAIFTSSVSGLRVSQAAVEVVSNNIANADSVGYTRRQLVQTQQLVGDRTAGVRSAAVNRMLDILVQRQLRQETGGAGYTSVASKYQTALDQIFGPPGGASALDTIFNKFTESLQTLTSDPASLTNRSQVLSSASAIASALNSASSDVQTLRGQAESAIASTVGRVNDLLSQIRFANSRIVANNPTVQAGLQDDRDAAIDELSKYLDIRVTEGPDGGVTIATSAGATLFNGSQAMKLVFDEHASLGPQALYSTDPAKRGVGAIMLTDGSGASIDMIANQSIRSGELAGLIEMRDTTLVQAQTQLDALAANLSSALSDRQAPTTAVTSGAQTGFDIDLSTPPASGNAITFFYKDAGGVTRTAKVVRVEDPSQLPLPNDGSADQVVGMSFSGAPASIVGALNTAFGPALSFSSAGSTLRVLDNGASTKMIGADARITNTALTGSGAEIPLFYDGGNKSVFTGSYDGGSKTLGFAARIALNPALAADPSRLVVYETSPTATPAGDSTRPQLLYDRLVSATRPFATTTGVGGTAAPYNGSVATFVQRVVEQRGAAAEAATQLDKGQNVALSSVQSRYAENASVNIDSEMAQLTQLQNAYAANARVFTAAKDMFDLLMRM